MSNANIDYSRKWYVMAAVGMSIFLSTVDGSIVNVALPTLIEELKTDFPTVQWVVLSYLLTQTTLMLSIGRLGDMVGKKSIYTAGLVIFTAGSVLCGFSPNVYWLIGFRVIQAIGAAMALALGYALVTEAFPAAERGKALGINGTIVSVGIVSGPVMGGLLIDALSWHWIFFVNLPFGIIGTFMAIRYLPDIKPEPGQKFDYWGGLTMFISLLAFLLALTIGQNLGFTDNRIIALFVIWFLFLIIFLLIEWRIDQPMINLKIFRNELFSINLITGYLTFVAIAGTFILLPFYLEDVLGYNTLQTGLLLAAIPVMLGISAPIAGIMSDKFGTRPITVIGLIFLTIGYISTSTLTRETTTIGYIIRLIPLGVGMGVFQSPNNSAVMGAAPPKRLGIASGLLSITRTLGQTTGIAILGALWASRVIATYGQIPQGGATTAPFAAQVTGLQQTFYVVAAMIFCALLLATWAWAKEQRNNKPD